MKKIAFHNPAICIRGTSNAIYDYARYNELLLDNKSIILCPEKANHDPLGVEHCSQRFNIVYYKDLEDMDRILLEEKCDVLYCIKYGKKDGIFSKKIKTVIHCVFDMSEPHGNVYAGVSESLAKKFGSNSFVPHMIGLSPSITKENLRNGLKIPENALVFGRYGGIDTAGIEFCWQAIREILEKRDDIYFLFGNTPQYVVHPRVFYRDKITSEDDKNRFICTCDAHLEIGHLGHSFGLSIGENSVNNKPIIAYKSNNLWNTAHIDILKDKGLYFTNKEEFYILLNNFNRKDYEGKDLNCYKDYTPEKVMQIFKKVFIEE